MKLILAMLAAALVPVSPASAARQAVAVAFLEPKTEVDVDVVSGTLSVGGYQRPFYEPEYRKERPELAGFVDPYTHGLFVYRSDGIPGLVEPDRSLGAAEVPSPGVAPWNPPQLQSAGPHVERVVLADGRYAEVETDENSRALTVRWPTAQGPWVTSNISYGKDATTVRMPFGIDRTYVHDSAGRITRILVPGAHRHATDDTVDGMLDTHATGRRRILRLPVLGGAEHAIEAVSGGAIGNIYQDQSFNRGYEVFGVNSIAVAERINRLLAHLGLLDVAEAMPELRSFAQFMHETRGLAPLFRCSDRASSVPVFRLSAGVEVSIARTITAPEVERLDGFLATIPDWVYIDWGSPGECTTPD
jgi:hypothetical protein